MEIALLLLSRHCTRQRPSPTTLQHWEVEPLELPQQQLLLQVVVPVPVVVQVVVVARRWSW
jgi:hypothetical protein